MVKPNTAMAKLLSDYGYSGIDLVKKGYFSNPSSAYSLGYKDVKKLSVRTIMNLSNALGLNPGNVLNKLLELQKSYPPKYPM